LWIGEFFRGSLALATLGPVIVNILLTGVLISSFALPMAVLLVILWLLTAWRVRSALFPLLQMRVADETGSRMLHSPARIKPAA
jgi:fatty acid desaturase